MRRRHIEIASYGVDEALQGLGGDPYGGISNVGLRVPTAPTPTVALGGLDLRYMFNLASFTLGDGARARIVGYRQLWTLGYRQVTGERAPTAFRIVEQLVTSPFFYLNDGGVSWHLHTFDKGQVPDYGLPGPVQRQSMQFRMGDNPAFLYETFTDAGSPFYVNLTAYSPPNKGRPWGTAIDSQQATFLDQRSEWRTQGAWRSLDIPVEGPSTFALFASVRQTNPSTRTALIAPAIANFYPAGLSPEEQFLLNFPNAIIWRVGGALAIELDDC